MSSRTAKTFLLAHCGLLRGFQRIVGRVKRWCFNPYHSVLRGLIFTAKGCRYETDGCRFILPRKLISLPFRAQFHADVYEKRERSLVREFIRSDDKVLELGACLGVVACVTETRLTNEAAKHVVVEANPYLIPWVFKNRHRNGVKFVVEFCAIADGAYATFNLNDRIDRGSLQQEGSSSVSVPCRTVEELERKHGAFNALVMDIQGAEIDVLKMTGDLLSHYRLLIIEWHESITGVQTVKDSRAMLERCGFTLSRQIGPVEAWERATT
ncbi:MAG: FkbM family methyltransferase [Planctomycetota bacterium]|jgi:FkbM family methyltransferase